MNNALHKKSLVGNIVSSLLRRKYYFVAAGFFLVSFQVSAFENEKRPTVRKISEQQFAKNIEKSELKQRKMIPVKESLGLAAGTIVGGAVGFSAMLALMAFNEPLQGIENVLTPTEISGLLELLILSVVPLGTSTGLIIGWLCVSEHSLSSFLTRIGAAVAGGLFSGFIGAVVGFLVGLFILIPLFATSGNGFGDDLGMILSGTFGGFILANVLGSAFSAGTVPILDALVE